MSTLHLFTGDHAARTVQTALGIKAADMLIQHDVISCGPVRRFESRDEWIRTRDDFWMDVCGGPALEEFPEDLLIDAERLAGATKLVIWMGAGLSDRLLLPTVLALGEIIAADLPPIEVAGITAHETLSVPVLGWGQLRPTDVGRPAPRPLAADDRVRARRAWAGLSASSPASLMSALDTLEDDAALLGAMVTLIERYPDTVRGLSHWDAALMASIPDAGADAFTIVGGAIGSNHQHPDPVGDAYLFWRLRRFADPALRSPLLELSGDTATPRHCRVTLTPFGRTVRDGNASHVAANGIDDWIGGVHLRQAAGSPWYRRAGQLISSTDQ